MAYHIERYFCKSIADLNCIEKNKIISNLNKKHLLQNTQHPSVTIRSVFSILEEMNHRYASRQEKSFSGISSILVYFWLASWSEGNLRSIACKWWPCCPLSWSQCGTAGPRFWPSLGHGQKRDLHRNRTDQHPEKVKITLIFLHNNSIWILF